MLGTLDSATEVMHLALLFIVPSAMQASTAGFVRKVRPAGSKKHPEAAAPCAGCMQIVQNMAILLPLQKTLSHY